jgi:hypothetical protein
VVEAAEPEGHEGGTYDVAVAVVATDERLERAREATVGIPGFEDTRGRSSRSGATVGAVILEKGDDALRIATEAIAGQINVTAQRIAETINKGSWPLPQQGELGLQGVEITFGVTLTSGIQAMFTAQAGSSAQITIRLGRSSEASPASHRQDDI